MEGLKGTSRKWFPKRSKNGISIGENCRIFFCKDTTI